MSFLGRRGIESEYHVKNKHAWKPTDWKHYNESNSFSERKDNVPLIDNMTGDVSEGFVRRTKDNKIVNAVKVQP